MTPRQHRHEAAYPAYWRAVDGAIRAAVHAHPEIVIPNRASLVKRVVGQVLAVKARPAPAGDRLEVGARPASGEAATVKPSQPPASVSTRGAS